ncbi:MAG: cytochrome c biogenesis protein CcsA [Chloroflexi bacterium]|nr:cytochrome c biogenesis protein CcsA [Chloroflexota bacterium]
MSATVLPLRVKEDPGAAAAPAPAPYWRLLGDRTAVPLLRGLAVASVVTIGIALYMALFYAPREATMGDAQRIFYFHVPSAWIGFLAFGVVFVSSIMYLIKGEAKWDALALSSAEMGVIFTTLVLLTGPLWAKVAWGTYWTWDARLTTTLILWMIYVGYLRLRSVADSRRMSRLAAITGIIGFLNVPLIYLSVVWWRTMHPSLLISSEGGLDERMRATLMVALLSFTLLYGWFLLARVRLEQRRNVLAARLAAREN